MPEDYPCPAVFGEVCDHPDSINCGRCKRNQSGLPYCLFQGKLCTRPDLSDCDDCEIRKNAENEDDDLFPCVPYCSPRDGDCWRDPPHDCDNCEVWRKGDICWVITCQEVLPLATPIVIDEVGETTVEAHWYAPYDTQLDPFEDYHESFSKKDLFPTMTLCLDYLKSQSESYARQNAGHLLGYLQAKGLENALADKLGHLAEPIPYAGDPRKAE